MTDKEVIRKFMEVRRLSVKQMAYRLGVRTIRLQKWLDSDIVPIGDIIADEIRRTTIKSYVESIPQ